MYYYLDERCEDNQVVYTKEQIDKQIDMLPEVVKREETVSCLVQALKKYKTEGMGTLIVGSRIPLYEGVCISLGISPTTVDYNKVMSYDDRVRAISMAELESEKRHDSAISISSYEHSGLGRYGDPLDPFGDTKAMSDLKRYVKENALLFLSVPVGKDALVWNAHRIYGDIRLPLLMSEWTLVESFGFSPERHPTMSLGEYYQPVFVLKNS